ncbi:phenoloxidase-activating factor 2 [Drosophila biarmipes]|uniref:phenoloxidase-activating factor 2 n=1 Tax=Drosophila biarmipes TaxID=125945 RepID=UPI0007E7E325|nr:phenoloxidase-activating factor 2 [Drosophila biarmipes]
MVPFWAVEIVFLASVILSEACNYCVPRYQCKTVHPTNYNSSFACAYNNHCCNELKETLPEIKITPWPPVRNQPSAPSQEPGLSNPDGLGMTKYVTEDQSKPSEFPWVVALFKENQYFSVGSLVSAGVVLTAAHGVSHLIPGQICVRAGEWDFKSTTAETRDVERIVSHENFDYMSGANNLALLFLKTPFKLEDHIRTIWFPVSQKQFEERRCTAAGWGINTSQVQSRVMKKVELPILNRNTCQDQLRRTILGSGYNLPQSLICAGGITGQVACPVDGGSPLFCSVDANKPHGYEQVGIASWSIDCALRGVPEIFTDVTMFKEWISEKIQF